MGNKQQLQLNNETLASILSNVLGLPSQESLKHGAYVWKKYSGKPKVTAEITVKFSQSSSIAIPTIFDVTSSEPTDLPVSELDVSSFDGLVLTKTTDSSSYITFTFKGDGTVKRQHSGNTTIFNEGTFTYDKTTGKITWNPSNAWGSGVYSFSSLAVEKTNEFLDFTVSDSPTAYPDGGEQGGYWYEIFKEKLTPSLFGFTKVAVDTFSFTSTTTITTGTVLNHSLGEVPRMWLILSTEPTVFHQTKAVKGYIAYLGGNGSNASGGVIYEDSTTSNGNQASSTAIPNSTQIPFTYDSILTNKYFIAGVQYTLITMA